MKTICKIYFYILLISIPPSTLAQMQMPKIAILDFATRGEISIDQATSFIALLRQEVAKIAGWHVLSDLEMRESFGGPDLDILRADNLEQAKIKARTLHAEIVLFGMVARQDSLYAIRILNYDLKREKYRAELTKSFVFQEKKLVATIDEITRNLDIGPNANVEPNDTTGVLSLTTEPDSCVVYLNDKMAGRTPLRLGFLPSGKYNLVMEKSSFKSTRGFVEIQAGKVSEYHTKLRKDVRLIVQSEPPGAMIYVNDAPVGTTPQSILMTSGTTYDFRFSLGDFKDVHKKLTLSENKTLSVNFNQTQKKWYYLGSGGAATLGFIYYLAKRDKTSKDKLGGGLPAPPGRP